MVAFCWLATADVVTGKLAFVAPVETVTLAGTPAAALLLDSVTVTPGEGAVPLRVTVPVGFVEPPVTAVALSVTLARTGVGLRVTALPAMPL
jgi:hypothetical protein